MPRKKRANKKREQKEKKSSPNFEQLANQFLHNCMTGNILAVTQQLRHLSSDKIDILVNNTLSGDGISSIMAALMANYNEKSKQVVMHLIPYLNYSTILQKNKHNDNCLDILEKSLTFYTSKQEVAFYEEIQAIFSSEENFNKYQKKLLEQQRLADLAYASLMQDSTPKKSKHANGNKTTARNTNTPAHEQKRTHPTDKAPPSPIDPVQYAKNLALFNMMVGGHQSEAQQVMNNIHFRLRRKPQLLPPESLECKLYSHNNNIYLLTNNEPYQFAFIDPHRSTLTKQNHNQIAQLHSLHKQLYLCINSQYHRITLVSGNKPLLLNNTLFFAKNNPSNQPAPLTSRAATASCLFNNKQHSITERTVSRDPNFEPNGGKQTSATCSINKK